MSMTLQEIETEAQKLREDEREILIYELMSGLGADKQKDVDQLQMKEVKARLKLMHENPEEILDADQVLSELQKEFE